MPVRIVDKDETVESEEAPPVGTPATESADLPYLVFALLGLALLVLGLWWFTVARRRRKEDKK
jgi:LPXTG-motif cell wall-anchored protein